MNRNTTALKTLSITAAALVYAGAVIYGDIMFLSVMQRAFPSGILGALAMAGALMTAASALTLPIALHWWLSPGVQYVWGIIFWLLDVVILMLNSMLAYGEAVQATDQWLATWMMIAPVTPLIAVLGWGIVFLTDPSHKLRHAEIELEADLIDIRADQLREAAKAQHVFDVIDKGAMRRALSVAGDLSTTHINPNGRKPISSVYPAEISNSNPTPLLEQDPTTGRSDNVRTAH